MLKRKLLSVISAVSLALSSMSGMVVNAADASFAPWKLYVAPMAEVTDMTKWNKTPVIQYFNNDATKPFISNVSASPINAVNISTGVGDNDDVFVCMGADNAGGILGNYGSPVVGFNAPNTGKYELYINSRLVWANDQTIGNIYVGIAENDEVAVKDTLALVGGAAGTVLADYKKEFELEAGQSLTSMFVTTADNWNRGMWVDYKITDMTTGTVYILNNMASASPVISSTSTETEWNLGDYKTVETVDNSMWSLYLAGTADNNDPGKNVASSGALSTDDFETWKEYKIEECYNAETNSVSFGSGATQFSISGAVPYDFHWRAAADSESNGTGTLVIGWTAPKAGDYIFDVSANNTSIYTTNHFFSYKKSGAEKPTGMVLQQLAGSAISGFSKAYYVEEGETIYLLNDANWSSNGNGLYMNYKITNAGNPSEVYSVSDICKTRLADSPYKLFNSAHGQVDVSRYAAADLVAENGGVSTTGKANYTKINADGTISIYPLLNDTADAVGEVPTIAFKVPADGYYKVDFSFDVAVDETQGGAVAIADLHMLTGYENALSATTGKASVQINMTNRGGSHSGVISAKKGDVIFMNMTSVGAQFSKPLTGNFRVAMLGEYNYTLSQGGNIISNISDIKAGETLTGELVYLGDSEDTVTLVMVAYGANNAMKEVFVSEPTAVTADTPTTVKAEFSVPENTTKVKLFALDGINTLVPLDIPFEV